MTRKEKIAAITRAAAELDDEQLDRFLDVVRHATACESVFETLTPEHQAAILKAKADVEAGGGRPAAEVFAHLDAKLKSYGA